MNRHTRQIRLAEVGESGQARIAAARPALHTRGYAAEIERRYLLAAGVAGVTDGPSKPLDDFGVQHGAARDVLQGALGALLSLREVLLP